jgi:hypothetical protein
MALIALRGGPKTAASFGLQPHLTHQAGDTMLAHTLAVGTQFSMHPQIAVRLTAVGMNLANPLDKLAFVSARRLGVRFSQS